MTDERKYCECCGRKLSKIREELENKEEWKGHKNYDSDYVYGRLKTKYCEYCGNKLDDEWIKTGRGGMPDELVVVGYECKNCDREVDF